ncbi:MAG TPA: TetR/AcrR family transcriptional regulator [Kofleriaceae bacterium]|nr:TetR/AcrR family transcriptional regulator [Kofleriaceae bacterium]
MARPKEFDRDAVLDRAVELFWKQGYEATSIGDLTEHLEIGRQSLYDTFGDKHALYVAALDRYRERYGGLATDALAKPGPLRKQVREVLRTIIDATTRTGQSCMLVNAVAERCPHDDDVRERFCANTAVIEEAFVRRFLQARRDGELASGIDPRALARYFVTTINGLQISARGGVERRALDQSADVAVSILT